ncbi:substrate-binding periplasmic protein [Alysiella filiformis]|uniref:Polar amino acid transport system substrate-binding protein n=1 Tax=Alysiella filiformis DSM 16848 TaxID=1120981 RepID=A0A286E1I1_9NEIS|nr:transporter substrate-binding domain-containing protein [Alysiella filiformis]QMT30746.1 transporter substrate-binding domain-containing protein [Alysiella filiformis]UBQ56274.1 transporter substrate-binding domain-containing protein [Alysiella filiformis DSM 16848]SOD64757.1 polar amino acid transport system substrate-binding protein [Alysiella filiformis DSM 16848]
MTKNIFLSSILALCLAACGGEKAQENTQPSPAAPASTSGKVIKVALDPLYPPFVQQTPKGLEGFDVDVLQAIADKSGLQMSFDPYPWEGLFERLNTGEVDIVAGGITVSESRKPNMDFSDSYNEISTVLLVGKDSHIDTFEQMRGKKVAYQLNTSAEATLQKLQGSGELAKDLGSNSAWETVKRVLANDASKVDATIGDSSPLEYYAKQYADTGLKVIYNPNLPKETNAFAVKKGNTELVDKLNKGLAAIKSDGTYDKIKEKWLGKTPQ